jgi:hypothetical protein
MSVLLSVVPTRYFLGRPDIGEEMHISIEKGKTLIIRLMAVGPVVEGRAQRDVWFEVNGEVDYISIKFALLLIIMVGPCGGYRGQKFCRRNSFAGEGDF